MKRILLAAAMALMLWGAPALAGPVVPDVDTDGDGVFDNDDNCTIAANPAQVDSDADFCGNRCDADYDNTGLVGFLDFSAFSAAYGTSDLEKDHTEPMTGPVGFLDFSFFSSKYGSTPGPSGTTPGSTACP